MKGAGKGLAVLLMLTLPAASVYGEAGKTHQEVEYATDYYMVVQSPDGGIEFYPEPERDSSLLDGELIPNGTALHITGEYTDDAGTEWGYTEYRSMNGYVLTEDLSPESVTSAAEYEFQLFDGERTNYEVEIEADSTLLYRGPGEKFGEIDGDSTADNGETYYISKEVEVDDGTLWGKASNEEKQGWIHMEDTSRDGKKETVAMEPTATPKPTATPTPEPTATATPEPTATATPEPTATATPEPTATATPKPTATATPEPTATVTPELTAAEAASANAENSNIQVGTLLLTAGILGLIIWAVLWFSITKKK